MRGDACLFIFHSSHYFGVVLIRLFLAFGFCDFYDAESALRAIRLLDKVRLAQKELQVKIGNKCHPLIIAYKSLMATRLGPGVGEDAVDEGTKLQDQMILRDIDMIIEDHEDELTKILPGKYSLMLSVRIAPEKLFLAPHEYRKVISSMLSFCVEARNHY